MKHKKDCGCKHGKHEKTRKMLKVESCFDNKTDGMGIFEAYKFQKNKPFKVTFDEGVNVHLGKQELVEKKLTKKDKAQKEEMVMKLKKNMGNLKKKYGNRAKGVMYAIATKYAKKKP
jgi:hypothetical protein